MESSLASAVPFRIYAQEKMVVSTVPLYPAMSALEECLIYYENKYLTLYDSKLHGKKTIPWTQKDGHVIDISWLNKKQCIILTKRQLHVLNVDNDTVQIVNRLPADDSKLTYHRCASYSECIMLCFSGPGTAIEQWTVKECTKRWKSPVSCVRDEHICCLRLSSNILGLTLAESKQGPRFEVRQSETMTVLRVIPLTFHCYRFTSLNEHTWLLVPYYHARQEILLIDSNTQSVRTTTIPSPTVAYDYNGNYNEMIWNVALMLDDSRRLIVRREKTVCFFNIT